jgi:hypothetical protein
MLVDVHEKPAIPFPVGELEITEVRLTHEKDIRL